MIFEIRHYLTKICTRVRCLVFFYSRNDHSLLNTLPVVTAIHLAQVSYVSWIGFNSLWLRVWQTEHDSQASAADRDHLPGAAK